MKDLYKILGVSEDADEGVVKKAFRKLAKANHPDATGGDNRKTERFKEVNEAYAVLGDKKKREEYDRLRHAPVGSDGMPMGFDADTFAQVFGGGGGFGRGGGGNVRVTSDVDGDLGDLFSSLFGGGGRPGPFQQRSSQRRVSRGPDLMGVLELDLREAALGTRKTIQSGSGASMEVQVPPGVDNGGRLRLPGQGGAGQRGGEAGDLHLEIRVRPDPLLQRNGHDIEMELPLTVTEAVLGTKVEVPTLEGRVHVTVPPGTSTGAKLRLRGRGVKRADSTRGDQIMRVQIVVPKLSEDDTESRRLIEEFGKRTNDGPPVRNFWPEAK